MEFYALLTAATLVIALLAVAVFRQTRDIGTLLGTAALYYWSLFGAWYIVIDKTGGFSGKHYQYLETKMFPIVLDGDYMISLCLYAAFIIILQLTLLITMPESRERPLPRLQLRHEPIIVIGAIAAVGSVLLIRDKLSAAYVLHSSAYIYTRTQTDQWFTLHQVLNRVALIPSAIGLATLFAGDRSRYFVSVRRRYTLLGYALVLGGMGLFTFLLGNKNEILTALIAGLTAYVGSVRRPNWFKVALATAMGFWFLYAIEFFRGYPLAEMSTAFTQHVGEATEVGRFVTSSNEAYAAHFSMYGVLSKHIEPWFGYSIYSLVCSIVPRVLWPDRPRDIYLYYSESVGTVQNQGYSLHHATGWYLNFGYLGVALGAIVMGLVWGYCITARYRVRNKTGLRFRLFAIVAPWLFVACLPPMLRAGPEAYKGLILEGALIPVLVLMFSCRPRRKRRPASQLHWNPSQGWSLVRETS
ncbi:MAG: hypothetical protein ABI824_15480 [Acidobacteriota bacterium]